MANETTDFDAIIVGSGQGGNPLAQKLAGQGLRVALIEARDLGGTCINTGCTPTKTMVSSAQVAHYARQAARWGVQTGPVSVDLAAVVERKRKIVAEFRGSWESKFSKQENLTCLHGVGRFVGHKQLQVSGQTIHADHIFIDTGSSSMRPAVEGLDTVPFLNNESLMELTSLPTHLVILGGGYIGLEFGQMFRRFGSEVTIVHNGPQILTREDADIARELQKALESEGIRFLLNARATSVQSKDGSVLLAAEAGGKAEIIKGSHLLVAIGREPNTSLLDLSKTGVATDQRGYVQVNHKLETNVEGIWALGDVTGGPAFTHISYNDYQTVYANVYEGKNVSIVGRIVPYAVFTDPQLGRVGITETEARAAGKQVKVGTVAMTSVARGIERNETQGLMKIVVDASNDQVLGASILAPDGGEVVQILHTLMLAKQSYTLLKGAIYIHPTIAEGFFAMLENVK